VNSRTQIFFLIAVIAAVFTVGCNNSSAGSASGTDAPKEIASETLPENPDRGPNAPADPELGGGE
jgi:PBP1b-binding outer membrane lipoprotein LpoB